MPSIQFYPLEVTYKVIREKPVVLMFGRTIEGKQICVGDETFEPYFYAVIDGKRDAERQKNAISAIVVEEKDRKISVVRVEQEKKFVNSKEISVFRIMVALPRDVRSIREKIRELNLECLEADIPYFRRYLIDKNIIPFTLYQVEGDFEQARLRVPYFKAEKIEQASMETIQNQRILALDIETYSPLGKITVPEKDPIIMAGLYGDNFQKVITWKRFNTNLPYIEFVEGEADLILRLKECIAEFQPDIIAGYFSDGFDLPYLLARAGKYKIPLDIGLDEGELKISKGMNVSVRIPGIAHFDIFKFIRAIIGRSLETTTFKLGAVAEELLDERKDEVDLQNLANAWENSTDELEIFCKYNMKDAYLTYHLAVKILPNAEELVKIVGLPLFDVSRMSYSQLVEWYLIKQAPEFQILVPNKPSNDEIRRRKSQTYEGAFVFQPIPGFYENIVIFDFRSLYPSIISTHHISPDTLNCECCEGDVEYAPESEDKIWFCKRKKGFTAAVIEDLIARRVRVNEILKTADKHNKLLLDARQYALKTIANAMYGYMGFFAARWYCIECAKSITAYGRYYIQNVIKRTEEAGFRVLYSDTDSIFFTFEGKTKEDALRLMEKINMELPGMMELDFEGFYPAGIFVSAKVGAYGAKKKYALINEDKVMKVRGFETVRSNWSFIAKETQSEVLRIILEERNVKKALLHLQGIVEQLRKNEIPLEKVTMHTQLQKEIDQYDNIGPHVAVAQKMRQMGKPVGAGSLIKFIVCAGKDRIRDRVKLPEECDIKDYDSDYYINNQVIPAVEKIFEVLGYPKDTLLAEKQQSKLDTYFK